MTYEENVRKVAVEMANDYFHKVLTSIYKLDYYDEWLELHLSQFEHSARIALRLQAEAVREAFSGSAYWSRPGRIDKYLIERGLIPAPEVVKLNGPACERCKKKEAKFSYLYMQVCDICHDDLHGPINSPSNEQK